MKKLLLGILTSIFLFSLASAQDVIIKKDGSEIESIVLEVGHDIIKYKKFSNQEGPSYTISKEEIFMIKYQNGDKDVFNSQLSQISTPDPVPLTIKSGFWGLTIRQGDKKLSGSDVKGIYSNYPEALSKYKNGKTLNLFGNIIGIPSAFVFGWEIGTLIGGGEGNTTALAISGVGFATGIILGVAGNNSIKKSVRIYNSEIDKTAFLQLDLGVTRYGVGLCLSF